MAPNRGGPRDHAADAAHQAQREVSERLARHTRSIGKDIALIFALACGVTMLSINPSQRGHGDRRSITSSPGDSRGKRKSDLFDAR